MMAQKEPKHVAYYLCINANAIIINIIVVLTGSKLCFTINRFPTESQFKERIIGKELYPNSDTIPTNGTQFSAVQATRPVLFEIQKALGW
jgi:hypothetical protein